jgi:hypothetical protein
MRGSCSRPIGSVEASVALHLQQARAARSCRGTRAVHRSQRRLVSKVFDDVADHQAGRGSMAVHLHHACLDIRNVRNWLVSYLDDVDMYLGIIVRVGRDPSFTS